MDRCGDHSGSHRSVVCVCACVCGDGNGVLFSIIILNIISYI